MIYFGLSGCITMACDCANAIILSICSILLAHSFWLYSFICLMLSPPFRLCCRWGCAAYQRPTHPTCAHGFQFRLKLCDVGVLFSQERSAAFCARAAADSFQPVGKVHRLGLCVVCHVLSLVDASSAPAASCKSHPALRSSASPVDFDCVSIALPTVSISVASHFTR